MNLLIKSPFTYRARLNAVVVELKFELVEQAV